MSLLLLACLSLSALAEEPVPGDGVDEASSDDAADDSASSEDAEGDAASSKDAAGDAASPKDATEAEEMAAAGFDEEVEEEPLDLSEAKAAVQALPLYGFSIEGGRSPLQANSWGLTLRTLFPHSSVQVGLGRRSNAPDWLWGPGISASGYLKRQGTGPSLTLGVAKNYIDVDQFVDPPVRYLRWAPYLSVGYRTLIIDRGAFALPLTGSVGLRRPPGETDLIDRSNIVIEITLGAQLNVQAL